MGQYSKAIITAAGQSLIARAIAGEAQLNITKAKTSDYKFPDDTDYKALTDMEGIKQVLEFPETKVLGNDLIQTRVLFSNEEIKATYYIQNIGLYANDGTKEVLFCIVTTDVPDEMPQYNGVAATSYIYNIQNVVKDAETIHITVSPAGNATIQDVMERVDATGGDISETIIGTLEPIDTKYPVPSAGESTKVFMGKVKKYIEDTKPLDADMTVYVSPTGSDTTGTGESTAPYKTITYALSKIPKTMNGFLASITISGGTYAEDVVIARFDGRIQLLFSANVTITSLAIVSTNVTCNSLGAAISITCGSITMHYNATLNSFITVNWNITSYTDYQAKRMSIIVDYESNLTASGIVELSGNDGIAIFCVNNSKASLGTVRGSGFNTGIMAYRNGQVTFEVNNLSATRYDHNIGGVIIYRSGALIGTLPADTTLYVATTGSDTTGDGTSAKPYKTIQKAIDVLPRDLNGHTATIIVSEGAYSENVAIMSFYSGSLILRSTTGLALSDAHKINSITCSNNSARVYIYGFNLVTSIADAFQGVCCVDIILRFITAKQSTASSGYSGFYFDACRARIESSMVANKAHGVSAYNSTVGSFIWSNESTGNTIGVKAGINSIVNTTGIQPVGTVPQQTAGGMFVKENGTQISGLITSGLSCTWADISGGYVRHGNLTGAAMVTVQIGVHITTNLAANTVYTLSGLPPVSFNGIPLASHRANAIDSAWIDLASLKVQFKVNILAGDWFFFGGTYLTYS